LKLKAEEAVDDGTSAIFEAGITLNILHLRFLFVPKDGVLDSPQPTQEGFRDRLFVNS
jgi:hypothetical protein